MVLWSTGIRLTFPRLEQSLESCVSSSFLCSYVHLVPSLASSLSLLSRWNQVPPLHLCSSSLLRELCLVFFFFFEISLFHCDVSWVRKRGKREEGKKDLYWKFSKRERREREGRGKKERKKLCGLKGSKEVWWNYQLRHLWRRMGVVLFCFFFCCFFEREEGIEGRGFFWFVCLLRRKEENPAPTEREKKMRKRWRTNHWGKRASQEVEWPVEDIA